MTRRATEHVLIEHLVHGQQQEEQMKVVPPARWWVSGTTFSGDWHPTVLAAGLLGLYLG